MSNDSATYQVKIQNDYYQLDLKAIIDLDVLHIYASKNTQLIEERNQRLLFQTAIENTSDSVMLTDTQGNIVYVNKAFEEHTGYTLQKIKGKNPRILNSGFQKPEIYREMWETISRGEVWKGLFRNKKKNGELFWEKATIIPVIKSDGSITHYLALKEDVTEELSLKEALNSFALFAKHNPSPVMRFSADGQIVEANPATSKVFGEPNIVGVNIFKLIPELNSLDINTVIKEDKKEIITSQIGESYLQLVIKGVNELQLCHVYGTDITAQKQAEKTIESMALFAKLNPEPVFRFNSGFKIVEANPAALETFPKMIKGNDIRDVIPPFADIPVVDFINGNELMVREETVKEKIYRFMIRGLKVTQVCQVYSSDITLRVEQEQMIKLQAEKISSSIKYASNIQAAVLPNIDYISEILPQNMLLYLPRDVVSGDFYWIKEVDEKIVIAIADCTGHGVPGAFMSMLGVAFLNEIVKPGKLAANEILNELRNYVIETLSNAQDTRADGMDMALCIIEPNRNTIQYAGAYNPFVLINDQGITEIKADRMPIGRHVKQQKPFTLHEIPYTAGDVVYLFSDGYQDQIGGPNLQKYGSKNFKELLLSIHEKDFEEQKRILIETLDNWSSTFHRIDDVIVMGFRL
ncbi:MAG: PAS domain S-box protein [Bacteroidales bacterium]|nr:PAS domain S-box protein [Bacteroidales bacterium]